MSEMVNPEELGKQHGLHMELGDLLRKMILEGVVDPAEGTDFTLLQSNTVSALQIPDRVTELGKHIVTIGIPNPLEHEFEELVLDEDSKRAKRERLLKEGEDLLRELKQDEEE